MRFKNVWNEPRQEISSEMVDEVAQVIQQAFALGINHIETAYGYIKSEHAYGLALNDALNIPRESYYLMTKGDAKTASSMREMVDAQLKALKTDYLDFYGYHGINNKEWFNIATGTNGPVEELLKMKEEGIIKHVGFSTHASLDVILDTLQTDLFEFMNLHYYYFFQRNKGAVDLAQQKDMGVFIISPNDKGGRLYAPPKKLAKLTAPLSALQFNARFCLSHPAIHTLTFGFPADGVEEQIKGIFPTQIPLAPEDAAIKYTLDRQSLHDPYADFDGYGMENDPSGINIPEILRFRKMWKCYDMLDFAKYRYNGMVEGDRWTPGAFPTEDRLQQIDMSRCPENVPLKEMLREAHAVLYKPKKPDLSKLVLDTSVKNPDKT